MGNSRKVFVDSHIFVDYYWDRRDGIKPLGEFAFRFFKRIIECEFYLLVSDDVVGELCAVLKKNVAEVMETIFGELIAVKKIGFVKATKEQVDEAKRIARQRDIPRTDALYAIFARDNNAWLVSRDKHHQKTEDVVEWFRPEEL